MNAIRRFFGKSPNTENKNSESPAGKPDLLNKEEAKKQKLEIKLEKKIEKYRKKYHEQRNKLKEEETTTSQLLEQVQAVEGKIGLLYKQLEDKKKSNQMLQQKISSEKKELKDLNSSLGSSRSKDCEDSGSGIAPSLNSLQFGNLKEKLEAKNKRVAELEVDIEKENQKTEVLLKEITFLKIELMKP